MSRNSTLARLRADVENQADIVGAANRYPPTLINRLINQSIQRFRERISNEGITHYLTATTGTLSSGTTSPYPFQVLDLSAVSPGIVRTLGVDLTVQGTVYSLKHVPFEERASFGTHTAQPLAWAHFQTAKIAILPAPDASYDYTVWYLPLLSDLTAETDTFDGVAGWEDFIVWDVVSRLTQRDTYQAAFALAKQQSAELFADIIRSATKVTAAGGTHTGRDTFGQLGFLPGRRRGPTASAGGGGSSVIANGSVTNAKLAEMAALTIKANITAVSASPTDATGAEVSQYILPKYAGSTPGLVPTGAGSTSLFLREDGTWAAPSVGGSVSGLTLSQLQNIAGPRFLGRFAATGAVEQITTAQVASMVPLFTTSTPGAVPYPTGGAAGLFLRDDATWAAPAGGGGSSSGISNSQLAPAPPLTVKGRFSTGSGAVEDVTAAQVASLLPNFGTASGATRGFVYSPTAGVAGRFLRDDGVFASVPVASALASGIQFGQLGAMQSPRILGRITGGSGAREQLTGAQVASFIAPFTTTTHGLVPFPTGGANGAFLKDDGTWAAVSGGGGAANNPGAPTGGIQFNAGSGVFGGSSGFMFAVGSGLKIDYPIFQPTGYIGLGATGGPQIPQTYLTSLGGKFGIGFSQNPSLTAFQVENNPALPANVKFTAHDAGGYGSPREWLSIDRSAPSGTLDIFLGHPTETDDVLLRAKRLVNAQITGTGAFIAQVDDRTAFRVSASGVFVPSGWLNVGALPIRTPTLISTSNFLRSDGEWAAPAGGGAGTPAGPTGALQFNAAGSFGGATGITITASGLALGVTPSGPLLHASGINMRSSDIDNVKRINGLQGIKVYGEVSGGGAASGTQALSAASGTAFIIPATVTTGQVFFAVPSLATHGDSILLENLSSITHRVNNTGTGMGAASGFVATLASRYGISLRFASGAWEYGNRYQLGGF